MTILEQMSQELGLSEQYLLSKLNRSFIFYSHHPIYNKHGEKRMVYEPSVEIKLFQKWVDKNILVNYPVSPYAKAYEAGTSIRMNAYAHRNSRYVMHTDIRRFFESISYQQVHDLFRKQYSGEDTETILKIVTRNYQLPIGSITAPKIANRIMYDFDNELVEELQKIQDIVYTRYADDIVISSNTYLDEEILNITIQKLKQYGFNYNKDKTYYSNKRSKRNITGVVISNGDDSLSIGWREYRELKLKVYKYLKYGVGNRDGIKGELAFLKSVNANKYLAIKKCYYEMDEKKDIFPGM